jgi:hypothetical protein
MRGHFFGLTEKYETKKKFKDLKENYSLISVPTASFLVYGSVILGWLVVVAFGIAGFLSTASA